MAHSPWFIINWPAMYFGTGGLRFVGPARNASLTGQEQRHTASPHSGAFNVDNFTNQGGWV
jgi:hypothetical protein